MGKLNAEEMGKSAVIAEHLKLLQQMNQSLMILTREVTKLREDIDKIYIDYKREKYPTRREYFDDCFSRKSAEL